MAMGKDDFLRLLVAQLQNQDPLSPMDGADFAAQLAQFSTVEQLIEIGAKLDSQAVSAAQSALTTQTMLGTSLIGRDVMLRGATLTADGNTPGRVAIDLEGPADKVLIEVLDSGGKVIGSQEFESVGEGRQLLELDGLELDAGHYNYRVTATGPDGAEVVATGYTVGHVDGVSFHGGAVALRIHGTLVPMLDILEVLAAGSSADGNTTNEEIIPT